MVFFGWAAVWSAQALAVAASTGDLDSASEIALVGAAISNDIVGFTGVRVIQKFSSRVKTFHVIKICTYNFRCYPF